MSCCFLPYLNMNQPQVYICSLPLKLLSHLPPHPIPLGFQSTSFGFPASYIKLPLAVYFTNGNIYVSVPLSHFPPSPSPL